MEEEHVPAGEAQEGTRPAEAGVIPSEGTKPGKRLSEEEILRRRKYIVIPAFVLVFLAVLCLIFAPSGDSGETAAGGSGFNVNVPEPTTVQLEGNKTDVYERQQARREKDRRMQSLSDLAGRLLEGKRARTAFLPQMGAYGSRRTLTSRSPGSWRAFTKLRKRQPALWNKRWKNCPAGWKRRKRKTAGRDPARR